MSRNGVSQEEDYRACGLETGRRGHFNEAP